MNQKIIILGILGFMSVLVAHDYIEFDKGEKSWF